MEDDARVVGVVFSDVFNESVVFGDDDVNVSPKNSGDVFYGSYSNKTSVNDFRVHAVTADAYDNGVFRNSWE